MNSDLAVRETMRMMAWERAKGELYSMMQTYYPHDEGLDVKVPSPSYLSAKGRIDSFVREFEDNCC